MIEIWDIENFLFSALKNHAESKRTEAVLFAELDFEGWDGVFCFRLHWIFANDDETKFEINISEAYIQYSNFEADIAKKYVCQIQDFINNQEL